MLNFSEGGHIFQTKNVHSPFFFRKRCPAPPVQCFTLEKQLGDSKKSRLYYTVHCYAVGFDIGIPGFRDKMGPPGPTIYKWIHLSLVIIPIYIQPWLFFIGLCWEKSLAYNGPGGPAPSCIMGYHTPYNSRLQRLNNQRPLTETVGGLARLP